MIKAIIDHQYWSDFGGDKGGREWNGERWGEIGLSEHERPGKLDSWNFMSTDERECLEEVYKG